MNIRKRVVITGLGTVNPLGNTAEETWQNICKGKSGISTITKFDTTGFRTTIAGEVKNFDALNYIDKKEFRRLDNVSIYALAASEMALRDADLSINHSNANRIGVILGSGIGGLSTLELQKELLLAEGPKKVMPFTIPAVLANLAPGNVAIRFGAKGPISCTVTACAAGNSAISDAFRTIAWGYADAIITGGTEAAITPLSVAGFNAMRALSTRNDNPEMASRPFDRDRDGFVIGEGCGIIILEELFHALNRRAPIYAEIAGSSSTGDAYHVAAPPPGHKDAARCMNLALVDAGMEPDEIDYINAHGTSTPLNDLYETQAIKEVFGDHSHRLAVSSTKSMTGHMLGAAGGFEAVIATKSICEGILPPTINLFTPDKECDLDYVPNKARRKNIQTVMSNTFGFGGVNTVIIIKKYEA